MEDLIDPESESVSECKSNKRKREKPGSQKRVEPKASYELVSEPKGPR